MTYATVGSEMAARLPEVRNFGAISFNDSIDSPYIIFGCHLLPMLEGALEAGDLKGILHICAFLEDAAVDGRQDANLETLLALEIGEWLGNTPLEAKISPWLGSETKRICKYVPRLGTQRAELRRAAQERGLKARIGKLLNRLLGKRSNAD